MKDKCPHLWCGREMANGWLRRHIANHEMYHDGPWSAEGCKGGHTARAFANYLKHLIYNRDKGLCQKCGTRVGLIKAKTIEEHTYEFHHIIPRCKGGCDCMTNIMLLCYKCHVETFSDSRPKIYEKPRKETLLEQFSEKVG